MEYAKSICVGTILLVLVGMLLSQNQSNWFSSDTTQRVEHPINRQRPSYSSPSRPRHQHTIPAASTDQPLVPNRTIEGQSISSRSIESYSAPSRPRHSHSWYKARMDAVRSQD